MAQKPADFYLPISAIKKILQDNLPASVKYSDTSKLALSKAACIFILYITTAANGFSQDSNRKRILGKDVIEALLDLELNFVVPALQTALAEHHKALLSKKQAKVTKKDAKNDSGSAVSTVNCNDLDVGEEVIIIGSGSDSEVGDEASEIEVDESSGSAGSEHEGGEEEEEDEEP